ncbi:hypothetical protein YC2023_067837 [Brassica napus]
MKCLAQVSRVDLAALAMASKEHRSLIVSLDFRLLRFQMRCLESNIYLWLHILPEPTPRWFILNPVHRRLKPIHLKSDKAPPESSSAFVLRSFGVFVVGGLVNGKPTSDNEVYAVDEDGQSFSFSPSDNSISNGVADSKPGYRSDWCWIGGFLFCGSSRGKILWCSPYELNWKEVKGLDELSEYDISKLCRKSDKNKNIVVFWNSSSLGSEPLEIWSAEISLELRHPHELWGKIEWSGSVFTLDPLSHSYGGIKLLYAVSIRA